MTSTAHHADPSHASPLGKATEYQSHYAPELLYPIPRQLKRSELGIADAALPFVGDDLWNAYELSWLNTKGKPVVAVGTFRVQATSPNLIESKSFKLYLNSFNQTSFDSLEAVSAVMTRDLSAAAGSLSPSPSNRCRSGRRRQSAHRTASCSTTSTSPATATSRRRNC